MASINQTRSKARALRPGDDGLPRGQRDALLTALGVAEGPAPAMPMVGLAALELLTGLAERRPLLVVVEDAHRRVKSQLQGPAGNRQGILRMRHAAAQNGIDVDVEFFSLNTLAVTFRLFCGIVAETIGVFERTIRLKLNHVHVMIRIDPDNLRSTQALLTIRQDG